MTFSSYNDFHVKDKVKVRKRVIDELLMTLTPSLADHIDVLKYVLSNDDILTIAKIEIKPMLYIRAALNFEECGGMLYHDQVFKFNPNSSFYYILK